MYMSQKMVFVVDKIYDAFQYEFLYAGLVLEFLILEQVFV
jgi:hypothetical protein